MITVIVPTRNSAEELPRCFDSLIGAVVRGIVREVIVADGGSTDDTRAIADATGAHFVAAKEGKGSQLAAGARNARGDWLLFLDPETALEPGWESGVEAFMARTTLERPLAASFRFAIDGYGAAARRNEFLAALRCSLFGLPYGEQALLIPKRLYQKLGGHRATAMEDVDLVRRIGRRRLVMLRVRAFHKPRRAERPSRPIALTLLHALRVPTAMLSRRSG